MGDFSTLGEFAADLGTPYRLLDRYYDETIAGPHILGLNPESFLAERLRSGKYKFKFNKNWPESRVRTDMSVDTAC